LVVNRLLGCLRDDLPQRVIAGARVVRVPVDVVLDRCGGRSSSELGLGHRPFVKHARLRLRDDDAAVVARVAHAEVQALEVLRLIFAHDCCSGAGRRFAACAASSTLRPSRSSMCGMKAASKDSTPHSIAVVCPFTQSRSTEHTLTLACARAFFSYSARAPRERLELHGCAFSQATA